MSYEIRNTLRSSSFVRAEGAGTYNITLGDLSTNTSLEVVSSASIKRLNWTANSTGSITIARGVTPNTNTILSLYGVGEIKLDEYGFALANEATSNIVVIIASAGSIIMEVSKVASYTKDLGTL